MELTGEPDGPPTRVGVSLIDSMSGLTGIVGLLACLLRARTTGRGLRRRDLPLRRRHASAHLSRRVVPQRGRRLAAGAAQRPPVAGAGPDLPDQGRLDLHHVHDPEVLAVARARRWAATSSCAIRAFPIPTPAPSIAPRSPTRSIRPSARARPPNGWRRSTACLPAAPVHRLDQALDSGFARADRHGVGRAASGEGQLARARQSAAHRRRAAGPGRLLAARRRQRHAAGQTHMKLEGLKVVDLSWFLPGPYLTTALADHGATVIKVEPPGEGDPGRHIRPPGRAHLGLLPQHGPRQEERRARSQERRRAAPTCSGWPARPTCWSSPSGPASRRASASATRR